MLKAYREIQQVEVIRMLQSVEAENISQAMSIINSMISNETYRA